MHYGARMSGRQTLAHLDGNVNRFGHGERTVAHLLHQRLARVIRHYDEGAAFAGFLQAVDGADVGVVERRGGARFTQKPLSILAA